MKGLGVFILALLFFYSNAGLTKEVLLDDYVDNLRAQFDSMIKKAKGKTRKLYVNKFTLTLSIVQKTTVNGGIEVYVAEIGGEKASGTTQTVSFDVHLNNPGGYESVKAPSPLFKATEGSTMGLAGITTYKALQAEAERYKGEVKVLRRRLSSETAAHRPQGHTNKAGFTTTAAPPLFYPSTADYVAACRLRLTGVVRTKNSLIKALNKKLSTTNGLGGLFLGSAEGLQESTSITLKECRELVDLHKESIAEIRAITSSLSAAKTE